MGPTRDDPQKPDPDLEESGFPAAKILAVDDNQANLLAISAILEPLAHELVLARSGAEALQLAAGDEFAVILLDVMMPEIDGFETLSRLRDLPTARTTPVVLLTAYELDLRDIERAYRLGAVDYILKPIPPEVLRGKVAALVSLHRRGQELRRRGAALQAKDRHIAVLAHDLQNPLTVLTTSTHALLGRDLDPKVRHSLSRIARVSSRMSDMIRDLMDYARTGAGAIPIAAGPMDLGDLCRELCEDFHLADANRRIELDCSGDLTGEWDRDRLFQALSNLVGNATRYGRGTATIGVHRQASAVEIAVHNDGPPIPPRLIPIIFEPFERGSEDRTGLGLGLYIVREIARAHGGEVSVSSTVEAGTTFKLRLPVHGRVGN